MQEERPPNPPASPVLCEGGTVTITVPPGFAGSASPQITESDAGVYTLTVNDANGCSGTDSVKVVEKKCMMGFFMPTAFGCRINW